MKYILLFYVIINLLSCSFTKPYVDEEKSWDYYQNGLESFKNENLEKAQAYFELAYENGMHAEALDALGCIALRENSLVEAKKLFNKAIKTNRELALVYGHLAFVYEELNERDKAKKLYLKALEINPNNYRFRNNLSALVYDIYKKEDPNNAQILAQAELKKALILKNDNKKIIKNIKLLEGINNE